MALHQARVALSLDRPPVGRREAAQAAPGPDQLRFAILAGYDREERASWQDGEGDRPERFIKEIAVEVVTSAEISYRKSCVSAFEWRVRRKAQREEAARQSSSSRAPTIVVGRSATWSGGTVMRPPRLASNSRAQHVGPCTIPNRIPWAQTGSCPLLAWRPRSH